MLVTLIFPSDDELVIFLFFIFKCVPCLVFVFADHLEQLLHF